MALSGRDLELLQGAALELHEPRTLEDLREVAPVAFKRVIPADYFLRLEYAPGPPGNFDRPMAFWEHPARARLEQLQKAMSFAPIHPFTAHVLRTGDLGPLRLSDFWTRPQQLASPIHRQVYHHLGIGRMLTIAFVRGSHTGAINLCRPFRSRDFSERDRHLLRLLAPHFLLAVNAAERASTQLAVEAEALAGLGLTPRERDVAAWLAYGRTNPEIAAIISMRPRTVEKHVERILLKLGVENRTSAARVILGLATVSALSTAPDVVRAREAFRDVLRPAGRRGHNGRKPTDGN
jgi:DNA-binding CsgD family transcriptional regulator